MKRLPVFIGILVAGLVAIGWLMLPTTEAGDGASRPVAQVRVPDRLSPDAVIGKRAFDSVCAACHGDNAAGREVKGPPLVHDYYKPSHHADMAFVLAVQNGVRAHHWRFGDMPPQQGLTRADIDAITTYIRALQRANGIN